MIIVALIGVYYLGKHSSSLNVRDKEGEKRYLRGPFYNGVNYTGSVVERPEQVQQYIDLGNLPVLSKINNRDNNQREVLQKGTNSFVHREEAVKITDPANKPEKVTPPFPAEQTNRQVKTSQANQNHKANMQQHEDTSQMHDANS